MSGMADPGVAMRGGLRRRFVERIVEPAVVLAEERSGRVVRCYALAGSIVRVTFAGAPLAERLGRAFAHALLPDHQGSVDLDVHVWDSASNGLPPPAHMLPETEADGLVAADEPGLLAGFVSKEDTLNLIDFERAQAYFWLSSLEAVPGWVTAAPLRRILQWFFAPRDVHLMHGAAVGRRMLEGGLRTRLVVSVPFSLAELWLAPRLALLLDGFPHMAIDVRVEDDPVDVVRQNIDLEGSRFQMRLFGSLLRGVAERRP